MKPDVVLSVRPLPSGVQPWPTVDPFLFCVHHSDAYPKGNAVLGPASSLAGRDLGMDFAGKDGWRMYHGDVVPGFPRHPHRGFETITLVRRGFIDHSDSLGAKARFGNGDVQWMTAGKGIQHAEMFPLLRPDAVNPVELFQIWLNLPAKSKMVAPHFSMMWNESIPRVHHLDSNGCATDVVIVAGRYQQSKALPPPPHSWANHSESDLGIFTLRMDPHARFTLPPALEGTLRSLFFFRGSALHVADAGAPPSSLVLLEGDAEVLLENGPDEAELLLLQGRPIGETVVQQGPFVMNTAAEIRQAFADYQRTQFGHWPWRGPDPVHPRDAGRFAQHVDGHMEKPAAT